MQTSVSRTVLGYLYKDLVVNKYGLIYEWKGSDQSLKPLLLTAHQGSESRPPPDTVTKKTPDVVPVEPATLDEWLHPPFSGFYDGKFC